jgi:hypothetical protein
MDQARARKHGTGLGNRLTDQAFGLPGRDAVLTVIGLQNAGKRPDCGVPAREQVIDLVRAGDAGIGTVILIRDHEYVCEDRGARRVREDPAAAVNLAGEMRAIGLMEPGTDRWRSRSSITWSAVRMPRTRPGSATAGGE